MKRMRWRFFQEKRDRSITDKYIDVYREFDTGQDEP